MLSPLRNRFGIPGVISVIALVFAMFGGAYAASNDSSGGEKASASAAKGPLGPRGKRGKPGPPGPAGPAGPAGAKGDTGAAGSNGSNGTNGKSAEAISFTGSKTIGSVTCTKGGVEVKSASATTLVCNGKDGTNGAPGESGFTETLPAGETETGTWAFGQGAVPTGFGFLRIPISFSIPLAEEEELEENEVHYIDAAGNEVKETGTVIVENPPDCTGSAAAPTAAPGHLCVYEVLIQEATVFKIGQAGDPGEASGASTAGAVLVFFGVKANSQGFGTWAVTAEEG